MAEAVSVLPMLSSIKPVVFTIDIAPGVVYNNVYSAYFSPPKVRVVGGQRDKTRRPIGQLLNVAMKEIVSGPIPTYVVIAHETTLINPQAFWRIYQAACLYSPGLLYWDYVVYDSDYEGYVATKEDSLEVEPVPPPIHLQPFAMHVGAWVGLRALNDTGFEETDDPLPAFYDGVQSIGLRNHRIGVGALSRVLRRHEKVDGSGAKSRTHPVRKKPIRAS
jgi:hypothetical protein